MPHSSSSELLHLAARAACEESLLKALEGLPGSHSELEELSREAVRKERTSELEELQVGTSVPRLLFGAGRVPRSAGRGGCRLHCKVQFDRALVGPARR